MCLGAIGAGSLGVLPFAAAAAAAAWRLTALAGGGGLGGGCVFTAGVDVVSGFPVADAFGGGGIGDDVAAAGCNVETGLAEESDPAAAGPGRAWMLSMVACSDPMLIVPLSDASSALSYPRGRALLMLRKHSESRKDEETEIQIE